LTALVRSGGTAVVIGLYAGQHPVDLAELVSREIAVVGTRALGRADTPAALDVLTRCGNDLLALIDDVVTPDATMQALERLRRGDVTKVLVDCSSLTE
jgi:threonine dehydrogenase-like Zn-dependent dehydrogenase